jgi:hypothetical protein
MCSYLWPSAFFLISLYLLNPIALKFLDTLTTIWQVVKDFLRIRKKFLNC